MVIRVKTPRCKEGWFPSFDLKICTCSMLTLCGSMSLQLFFFFHLCQTLDTLLKLVCGEHNKEQKKALKETLTWKKMHWHFLFNIAWTLPAYAHAQNCPTRLTMYHLFSLDPIVDLFTNIKCLQANPSCCMFAAYCGR